MLVPTPAQATAAAVFAPVPVAEAAMPVKPTRGRPKKAATKPEPEPAAAHATRSKRNADPTAPVQNKENAAPATLLPIHAAQDRTIAADGVAKDTKEMEKQVPAPADTMSVLEKMSLEVSDALSSALAFAPSGSCSGLAPAGSSMQQQQPLQDKGVSRVDSGIELPGILSTLMAYFQQPVQQQQQPLARSATSNPAKTSHGSPHTSFNVGQQSSQPSSSSTPSSKIMRSASTPSFSLSFSSPHTESARPSSVLHTPVSRIQSHAEASSTIKKLSTATAATMLFDDSNDDDCEIIDLTAFASSIGRPTPAFAPSLPSSANTATTRSFATPKHVSKAIETPAGGPAVIKSAAATPAAFGSSSLAIIDLDATPKASTNKPLGQPLSKTADADSDALMVIDDLPDSGLLASVTDLTAMDDKDNESSGDDDIQMGRSRARPATVTLGSGMGSGSASTGTSDGMAVDDKSDDMDEDNWENEMLKWNQGTVRAFELEADWVKKTIEMIPVEESLEQALETGIADLKAEYGDKATPAGMSIELMKHQIRGLAWLVRMENHELHGGILADDMGMGKTVQMLALMMHHRRRPTKDRGGTLIIAPLALITQWRDETIQKCKGNLSVYVHHGPDRTKLKNDLRRFDVVITTYAVATIEAPRESVLVNGEIVPPFKGGPLFRARWHRVILDEAQMIKNRTTRASIACSALDSISRFSLSGTPVQNNVDEVYSQFRFLRIPHWSDYRHFYEQVTSRIRKKDEHLNKIAIQRLQVVLGSCLLRRIKTAKDENGDPILTLPERNVDMTEVDLSPEEREFYSAIETFASNEFNKYMKEGSVMKNYSNVLVLLLRLRQAATHPHLVKEAFEDAERGVFSLQFMSRSLGFGDRPTVSVLEADDLGRVAASSLSSAGRAGPSIASGSGSGSGFGTGSGSGSGSKSAEPAGPVALSKELLQTKRIMKMAVFSRVMNAAKENLRAFLSEECPLCIDIVQTPSITSCGHMFCRDCINEHLQYHGTDGEDGSVTAPCPVCRANIKTDGVFPAAWFASHVQPRREIPTVAAYQPTPQPSSQPNLFAPQGIKDLVTGMDGPAKPVDLQAALQGLHPDGDYSSWISSSKVDKMVKVLEATREEDPLIKTVVFSQWTSNLDLMEVALRKRRFRFCRYDGGMSHSARDEAIRELYDNRYTTVILVSLKCGGVGLNLNVASRVIMMDLWWNPAVEDQAIDRVHRIGQKSNVSVSRLVAKGTVEERIHALQEQKRKIAAGALGEGEFKLGRLSMQELVFLFRPSGLDGAGDADEGPRRHRGRGRAGRRRGNAMGGGMGGMGGGMGCTGMEADCVCGQCAGESDGGSPTDSETDSQAG
ncbi:SNF2 family N-terminal domain-containing protein [Entophlyctis helioformis]|nr:SNF2 family N-terminal domain-containing protein [Entophlyctis helioformis]